MANSIISVLPLPVEIQKFLNDLINEAGLEKTDPILKEMMAEDLATRFEQHIILTLAKNLESNDIETFGKLAAVDQQKALEFLQEKLPQAPQILLDAIGEFKAMFLKQK